MLNKNNNIEDSHYREECFSMMTDLPNMGQLLVDEKNIIVYTNKWVCDISGSKHSKIMGKSLPTLFREQDRHTIIEAISSEGVREGLEVGIWTPEGKVKGVELTCVVRKNQNKKLKAYVTLQDISWHKDMECITRHAHEKLGKIEEMVDCGILVFNKENTIVFANQQAAKIVGCFSRDLSGMGINILFGREEWNSLQMLTEDLVDNRYRCVKINMLRFDGSIVPVQISLGTFHETPSRNQTYVVFRDLTSKIRIENELRKINKFLENVIHSSVDGIIAADIKGNIIIFNEGAERLLGYCAKDVIGKLHINTFYPQGIAKNIMRELRGESHGEVGKLPATQTVLIAKSGIRIPVNISAAIIYEREMEIATVGIFADLRERIEMQKQLDLTYQQLYQSDKLSSLGTLAAGVAHEINNPLNNISTTCQILLEDLEEELSVENLERLRWIEEHVYKASDIVRALLEFSREHEFRLEPINFQEVVDDTLKLIKGEIPSHIDIEVTLQDGLIIDLDKTRMGQALMNIIINGIHSMQEKGVLTIRGGIDPRSNLAEIIVKDTGTGISGEHMPHIFDPFFTTKPVGKGTGLGLSLSYKIIERHGGKISVRSRVGRGTQFSLEFPLSSR